MTSDGSSGSPREVLERLIEAALIAVEPGEAVRSSLRVQNGGLVLSDLQIDPSAYRRAIVVGAGKASAPMAAAAESILTEVGLKVEGSVTVRYGHGSPTRWVRIREAGHPIPDRAGVEATQAIARMLDAADARDLVVCVISGGGSALLTLPAEGITLEDLQQTTDLLLRSGATINELNTVRKHLDAVKGGGLARLAAPAPILSLILSDVVGNPLDAIASGPTVPDTTTWEDASAILERYGLWDEVPPAVAERLREGRDRHIPDTPKRSNPMFNRDHVCLVGSNLTACQAAAAEATRLGLNTIVLSTSVEGEARDVGRLLGGILREVHTSGNPLPRPCCILAGGETTVTVRGSGKGGRNQEVALGAASVLRGIPDVLFASIGTDGTDGPTEAAGAVVDGTTLYRAAAHGLDPKQHLAENDAFHFFQPLGDLILTGPTNTNVNDLYVLLAL